MNEGLGSCGRAEDWCERVSCEGKKEKEQEGRETVNL